MNVLKIPCLTGARILHIHSREVFSYICLQFASAAVSEYCECNGDSDHGLILHRDFPVVTGLYVPIDRLGRG